MAAINEKNLQVRFDSAKSFYGKARVRQVGDNYTLMSYQTAVMRWDGERLTRKAGQPQSQTTARHMREWAQQLGFPRMNAAELRELPTFC